MAKHKASHVAAVSLLGIGSLVALWVAWSRYGYARMKDDFAFLVDNNGQPLNPPLSIEKGTVVQRRGPTVNDLAPIRVSVSGTAQTDFWCADSSLGGYLF